MSKKITFRAKAFSNEGIRTNTAIVEDGNILVWDSVAGHFTSCHSLSNSTIKRIKAMAV